jgi:hypothetical protein
MAPAAFSLIRCCIFSTGSCRLVTSNRLSRPRRLRTARPSSNHAVAFSPGAAGGGRAPRSARRSGARGHGVYRPRSAIVSRPGRPLATPRPRTPPRVELPVRPSGG